MKSMILRLQESVYSMNRFPYNQEIVLLKNRQDFRGPLPTFFPIQIYFPSQQIYWSELNFGL